MFEALSNELGAQDAFLGGGRYDVLSQKLGGKNLPAIGMAIGVERLASISSIPKTQDKIVSFITITSKLEPKAFKIAHHLRSLNKKINLDVNLANGSLKSKLRRANKINASHALIIGDDEITNECILIKYLDDELKEQELVKFDEAYEIYKLL